MVAASRRPNVFECFTWIHLPCRSVPRRSSLQLGLLELWLPGCPPFVAAPSGDPVRCFLSLSADVIGRRAKFSQLRPVPGWRRLFKRKGLGPTVWNWYCMLFRLLRSFRFQLNSPGHSFATLFKAASSSWRLAWTLSNRVACPPGLR